MIYFLVTKTLSVFETNMTKFENLKNCVIIIFYKKHP